MKWSYWWTYINNVVSLDPDEVGVYELADNNKETVYYGRGKIKTNVLTHINTNKCPKAHYYRFKLYATEQECQVREEELLQAYNKSHGKLPIYNEQNN